MSILALSGIDPAELWCYQFRVQRTDDFKLLRAKSPRSSLCRKPEICAAADDTIYIHDTRMGVPARQGYRKPRRGYAYPKYIHLIRGICKHLIGGTKYCSLKSYEVSGGLPRGASRDLPPPNFIAIYLRNIFTLFFIEKKRQKKTKKDKR